jgi:histidyl-tRNA synthetase
MFFPFVYTSLMEKKRVKGCYDRYPHAKESWQQPEIWSFIDVMIEKITLLYGFKEVVTPSFEYTELFTRSSGEESDIVSKEMYTFKDKKGRSLSLRPELTAPTLRAYIEHGGDHQKRTKLFYKGSCYRYDRAQKGRYRQFNQFGVEVLGQKDPFVDIEVIAMAMHFFSLLGIKKATLLINSIGSKQSRSSYEKALVAYFSNYTETLSEDSKRRLLKNPLRILDSKDPADILISKNCPNILDYLDIEEKAHFNTVLEGLSSLGIDYKVEPRLVRGLDYYTDTVFEIVRENDGSSQNSLGGGGRYDGLVQALGGKDVPGIGFGLGLERVIQYLLDEHIEIEKKDRPYYYCIGLNNPSKMILTPFIQSARHANIIAEMDPTTSIKEGLKKASELEAHFAILIGEDEINQGVYKIKDLKKRQEEVKGLNTLFSLLEKTPVPSI